MTAPTPTPSLQLDLSKQEPIPPEGVAVALALMQSGKLHRYGETDGKLSPVVALVKALAKADEEYRKDGKKWTADTAQVKAIAKMTKADAKDVPAAMSLYKFPTPAQQLSAAWLGGGAAKAMTSTAAFLKKQGRIQEVKPDYAAFVSDAYVKKAGLK